MSSVDPRLGGALLQLMFCKVQRGNISISPALLKVLSLSRVHWSGVSHTTCYRGSARTGSGHTFLLVCAAGVK